MNSLASVFMDMEYLTCFFIFDGTFDNGIKNNVTTQELSENQNKSCFKFFLSLEFPSYKKRAIEGWSLENTYIRTIFHSWKFTTDISLRGANGTITEELTETYLPVCGKPNYGLRVILACWPAGIRFAQCIRRYMDSKKTFPHITNAGKYSTTFFKVNKNSFHSSSNLEFRILR